MDSLMGCGDEAFEERMRFVGFAVEFGMKLAGDKEWVLWQFDDLDEFAVRCVAAESEVGFFEFLAISVIEFVAVAMAFVDNKCAIQAGGFGADDELTWLRAEAHGAAFFGDAGLLVEHRDDGMGRVDIKFG